MLLGYDLSERFQFGPVNVDVFVGRLLADDEIVIGGHGLLLADLQASVDRLVVLYSLRNRSWLRSLRGVCFGGVRVSALSY